jgi:FixJ family two-component response regulator
MKSMVYIVDDDADIRQSLAALLTTMEIPNRSYANGLDFLKEFDQGPPSCVLLDLRLPGMTGIEVQERLNKLPVSPSIIFMTGHGDVQTAVRAMRAGAFDFLEKPLRPQLLLETLSSAMTRDIGRRLEYEKFRVARAQVDTLSPREKEVLELLIKGYSSQKVAMELTLAKNTVDNHRSSIMRKLGVSRGSELVDLFITLRSWRGR